MGIAWQYNSGSKHRIILKWWLLINIALMSVLSTFPSLLDFAFPTDSDHGIHAHNVDIHAAHPGHSKNPSESNEDGTQGKTSACVGHGGCRAKCCKTCIYCALALIAFFSYVEPLKKTPALPPFAVTRLSDYMPPLLERPPM